MYSVIIDLINMNIITELYLGSKFSDKKLFIKRLNVSAKIKMESVKLDCACSECGESNKSSKLAMRRA